MILKIFWFLLKIFIVLSLILLCRVCLTIFEDVINPSLWKSFVQFLYPCRFDSECARSYLKFSKTMDILVVALFIICTCFIYIKKFDNRTKIERYKKEVMYTVTKILLSGDISFSSPYNGWHFYGKKCSNYWRLCEIDWNESEIDVIAEEAAFVLAFMKLQPQNLSHDDMKELMTNILYRILFELEFERGLSHKDISAILNTGYLDPFLHYGLVAIYQSNFLKIPFSDIKYYNDDIYNPDHIEYKMPGAVAQYLGIRR